MVIGLGGVGSTAALALTMSGVGHLHCIEPDIVELSNLNRQILYTEKDIGRPKVDAAVDRLREHNSDILVTGVQAEVTGPNSLKTFVSGFDVLVLGADQPPEIRSWANQACRATATPWVHGGYHGPQVSIGAYRPGTGPCYDCAHAAETERRAALPPQTEWPPAANMNPEHAANAISAGMAGNLAAHAAMSILTGAPQLPMNHQLGLNLAVPDHSFILGPSQPRSDCSTCHGRP
ncbi:MAG: HesA/MoeB/ThiF family protein [Candidatus Dormibacteraceae bacterium]